ncbi:hypothetical protein TIFTF001_016322 [Ficus carica]|uniref:Uncharacterized protein n=1 Tax=Ficus carica TaxID=3494 RepID=A0AA88A627_FICCA|nr:hypothetical protein TIFTF001_016322 [Ficus carica]
MISTPYQINNLGNPLLTTS